MNFLTVALAAVTLSGCAVYTNPYTGQQEIGMTQQGVDVLAGAAAVGVAAALVNATYHRTYPRQESCGRYGCTTRRYYYRR